MSLPNSPSVTELSRRVLRQGAVEITERSWDAGKLALEGLSTLVDGDPFELVIRVPLGLLVKARIGVLGVELRRECVRLTPAITEAMLWTISFEKR